jgi:hypothetical protein
MNQLRIARILSVALHPFVIGPLTVALATRNWRWTLAFAATAILPLLIVLIRRTRRGEWSDFDVSQRSQRPGLYYAALPLLAVAAFVLWRMGASPRFLRSFLAVGFLYAAGLLGNRFLKISLHMMFGAFCLVVIAPALPPVAFLDSAAARLPGLVPLAPRAPHPRRDRRRPPPRPRRWRLRDVSLTLFSRCTGCVALPRSCVALPRSRAALPR